MQLQRDLGRAYARLGAAHAALAAMTETPAGQLPARWRQAVGWYEKSLTLWLDLRHRGLLSGDDLEEPDKVSKELEKSRLALGTASAATGPH